MGSPSEDNGMRHRHTSSNNDELRWKCSAMLRSHCNVQLSTSIVALSLRNTDPALPAASAALLAALDIESVCNRVADQPLGPDQPQWPEALQLHRRELPSKPDVTGDRRKLLANVRADIRFGFRGG